MTETMAASGRPEEVYGSIERPDLFYGMPDEDADSWIKQFEMAARSNRWPETLWLDRAGCRLRRAALKWFLTCNFISWRMFKEAFLKKYSPDPLLVNLALERCQQQEWETVQEYADRMRELHARLGEFPESTKVARFVHGLNPQLRFSVYSMRPTDFEQAVEDASYLQSAMGDGGSQPPSYGYGGSFGGGMQNSLGGPVSRPGPVGANRSRDGQPFGWSSRQERDMGYELGGAVSSQGRVHTMGATLVARE